MVYLYCDYVPVGWTIILALCSCKMFALWYMSADRALRHRGMGIQAGTMAPWPRARRYMCHGPSFTCGSFIILDMQPWVISTTYLFDRDSLYFLGPVLYAPVRCLHYVYLHSDYVQVGWITISTNLQPCMSWGQAMHAVIFPWPSIICHYCHVSNDV